MTIMKSLSKEEKQLMLNELFERIINEIPIEDVINRYLTLERKGFKCPFHNEETIGGFQINKSGNYFYCFGCEKGGNSIKFVSLFENITYFEAGIKVSLDFGLMSIELYDLLFKKKNLKTEGEKYQVRHITTTKDDEGEKERKKRLQSPKNMDKIFRLFSKISGLSDEHYEYLKKERFLSDKEIKKYQFFTLRNPKEIIVEFAKEVEKQKLSLNGVPGFYQWIYYNKWRWSYSYPSYHHNALGIPVMNEDGYIVGIQLRTNVDGKKYIWFSSGFAITEGEKQRYGMNSKTPFGIIKNENPKPYVFITEGFFKCHQLSKTSQMNGLYTSGVKCQHGILDSLEQLISITESSNKKDVKTIFLCFDADFKTKEDVFMSLVSLYQKIKNDKRFNNYEVVLMNWDIKLGKGIDDLINNHSLSAVERIDIECLLSIALPFLELLPPRNMRTTEDVESMFDTIFNDYYKHKNS